MEGSDSFQHGPDLFLDTIPEDQSVAVNNNINNNNLSTASAVASSDVESSVVATSKKARRGRPRTAGSDAGVSDIALVEEEQEGNSNAGGIPSKKKPCTQQTLIYLGVVFLLSIVVAVAIYFVVDRFQSSAAQQITEAGDAEGMVTLPPYSIFLESSYPSAAPSRNSAYVARVDDIIQTVYDGGNTNANFQESTPQHTCRHWLITRDLFCDDSNGFSCSDECIKQRYVLCVLYIGTNGEAWAADAVMSNLASGGDVQFLIPDLDECIWDGIACDMGNVALIELPAVNMTGTLPEELSSLSELQGINLASNSLTGNVPPPLWSMPKLVWLDLSMNSLEGSIPSAASLPSLENLYLFLNHFSGDVPYFPLVEELWVHCNHFTGIDDRYATSSVLESWILLDNELTGPMITEWDAPALQELDFSENEWTGTFPDGLWTMTPKLEILALHDTSLSGPLPQLPSTSSNLNHVWLHNNNFEGIIPESFGWSWANLTSMYLHHNDLEGTIDRPLCRQWEFLQNFTTDCGRDSLSCACCTVCYEFP